MPKSRKSHTPKARPKRPISGEWVSDELPPTVLAHVQKIRIARRKVSADALRKIGEAFSMYEQTSMPPLQLNVKKATQLRKALAKLVQHIDSIDGGLALALAVSWQRLHYDGSGFAASNPRKVGKNRANLTRALLPEITAPEAQAQAASLDGWPAARQWLRLLDAGLESAIDAAPIAQGGRPRPSARNRLLEAVTEALAGDGLAEDIALGHAADILDAAGIRAPTDERRLKKAAEAGVRKPKQNRRGLRTAKS